MAAGQTTPQLLEVPEIPLLKEMVSFASTPVFIENSENKELLSNKEDAGIQNFADDGVLADAPKLRLKLTMQMLLPKDAVIPKAPLFIPDIIMDGPKNDSEDEADNDSVSSAESSSEELSDDSDSEEETSVEDDTTEDDEEFADDDSSGDEDNDGGNETDSGEVVLLPEDVICLMASVKTMMICMEKLKAVEY